jgi:hypothetical protein
MGKRTEEQKCNDLMPNLKNFGKNKRSITNENMNCPSNL